MTDLALETELKVAQPISGAEASAFIELLKPRVMSLVIFTAFVGLIAAPGAMHPVLAFAAIALIAVGAGASGALNMWYDADIDAVMDRTKGRPIPSGRITSGDALAYGLLLSLFSVVFLALVVNITSAVLLAVTIAFYTLIYTMWLKRRTSLNIVIGGAAGAFPPMIGWAAVTDSVTVHSLILFAIIFLWTPPHFWALALKLNRDYGRVGIPMLPNVAGHTATRRQIFIYSLVLAPVAVLPSLMGVAGPVYGLASVIGGLLFVRGAWKVLREHDGAEMGLFKFSIGYLFGLFAVLAGERMVMDLMDWSV